MYRILLVNLLQTILLTVAAAVALTYELTEGFTEPVSESNFDIVSKTTLYVVPLMIFVSTAKLTNSILKDRFINNFKDL